MLFLSLARIVWWCRSFTFCCKTPWRTTWCSHFSSREADANHTHPIAHTNHKQRELASPTQYSARLLELQSQARALQQTMRAYHEQVELDQDDAVTVSKYIQQQQEALMTLCNIVADDLEDLKIMTEEQAKWA